MCCNRPVDVSEFVNQHVPRAGSRVLEVGCGEGELARALADRHDVTAVDPHAPKGEIFRQTTLEEFEERGAFDAVVANRSLHHIADLTEALKKIHRLLTSGGVVILNEFAWEQPDERTSRWYTINAREPNRYGDSLRSENFPKQWIEEHQDMHDSRAMRGALDAFFEQRLFEWVPYMAVYYLTRPDLVDEEKRLIDDGDIGPLGFRYVGMKD